MSQSNNQASSVSQELCALNFRVPVELNVRLEIKVARLRTTKQEIVRSALEQWLDRADIEADIKEGNTHV